MSALESLSDELHRTVKLALDTGEAGSVEDAVRIFSAYRAQFIVGPEVAESACLQAALLTAVNCAARTLLGGVTVVGAHGELRVTVPPFGASRRPRRCSARGHALRRRRCADCLLWRAV